MEMERVGVLNPNSILFFFAIGNCVPLNNIEYYLTIHITALYTWKVLCNHLQIKLFIRQKVIFFHCRVKTMFDISYEGNKHKKRDLKAELPILKKKTLSSSGKQGIHILLYKIGSDQEAFTKFLYLLDEVKQWQWKLTHKQRHVSYCLATDGGGEIEKKSKALWEKRDGIDQFGFGVLGNTF